MERITQEADFGLEDWEETLFFVKSDPNGAYNILDIAKYQGESEFDEILKNVALRLAAYENTDLEPDEIKVLQEYHDLHTADDAEASRRLIELAEADRERRCVVFQHGYAVVSIYNPADEDGLYTMSATGVITKEEYEAALRREQDA